MCDPTGGFATAAIAGSIFSAGTNIAQGIGERQLASAQARADDEQGRAELMAASERAQRIRMNGRKLLAEQRVQYANSGVEGGSGSALEVGKADAGEIELDALTELYGGVSRKKALNQQASFTRKAGVAAQTAGIFRGVSDVLGASKSWESLGSSKPK
jgi:hypothetical protein